MPTSWRSAGPACGGSWRPVARCRGARNLKFRIASDQSGAAYKYGYIDKSGKFIINPQFEGGGHFEAGLAPVRVGDRWGYVGKNGQLSINPQFEEAGDFADGLALVRVNGRYG